MFKAIGAVCAAGLLTGCAAIGTAPKLAVVADRPGCSSVARAFMSRDGAQLTADQVLAGVAECENRDRLGALQFDPNALGR
jgi:hypothetical protein